MGLSKHERYAEQRVETDKFGAQEQSRCQTSTINQTRRSGVIEKHFLNNRRMGKKGLIAYLNAGDPDISTTRDLIELLESCGVDVIELSVPFPNSCTDGDTILRSHDRALKKGVTLDSVLEMVRDYRKTSAMPIVLMADFGHTIKPCGLQAYLRRCKEAGIDGVLLHCLPPSLVPEYIGAAAHLELENIFSLYPITPEAKRRSVYAAANGFIYLVSQYGKTGHTAHFTDDLLTYVKTVRKETEIPLAVGFGVKNEADVKKILKAGADGAIIGSRLVEVIEANIYDKARMYFEMHTLFNTLNRGRASVG